jgi:hypothetical protein
LAIGGRTEVLKILRPFIVTGLVATLFISAPSPARADQVKRLSQILLGDGSYRVRMQAAIVLGRLRKLRAVPALSAAMRDDNANVRKVSAAALGEIGDRSAQQPLVRALRDRNDGVKAAAAASLASIGAKKALPQLKQLLRRSRSRLVREHVRRAINELQRAPSTASGARLVTLGKISNKTRTGGRVLADALGDALLREFGTVSGVSVRQRAAMPSAAALKQQKLTAFVIDGSIERLSQREIGSQVELTCGIRVALSTYPQNSMKAFYNGAASMAVGANSFNSSTAVRLYRELVDATAQEARKQIVQSYLRHQ